MSEVVLQTEIAGLKPFIRGKVRDVYDLGENLLIIATDRLSAFDVVLPTGIPDKGAVLTQISEFWFNQTKDLCPNHVVSTDAGVIREALQAAGASDVPDAYIKNRAMLVRKVQALPVECVVRGYLEGSGWKEYQKTQSVCGIQLPAGLKQGSQLPEPIFTPSTKAHTGHDENITHAQLAEILPAEQMDRCITLSLAVYNAAAEFARQRGVIIADTKFEFGVQDGQVIMIDECLTPDSSRFWDARGHQPGGPQPSYDKQFVRDYLDSVGWNHEPPAPALPDDVVRKTTEKYREIYKIISGHELA